MHRLLRATRNTANGLRACARSEQAFRKELVVLVIALPLACFVATNFWRWVALIGVLLLILVVELLNTGLEKLADRVSRETDPTIGASRIWDPPRLDFRTVAALVWLAAIAERLGLL